jgi:DNA-binding CsgD family transcriptional regulator/PAS domain-containing protein
MTGQPIPAQAGARHRAREAAPTGATASARLKPHRKVPISPERCAEVLGTLQEISKATPDLDGCRRLLECLSDELRAEQGVLILCNPLTRELDFVVHNQDPAVAKGYADYYCDLDPTGLPDYVRGRSSPPGATPIGGAVSNLADVLDYSSFVSTEFYNDFFKPADIHYDLVALVSPNPSARAALCLLRARRGRPFSAVELSLLEMIAPFVGNHLERMLSASLRTTLDTSGGEGVIVCDTAGRVLFCNDAARALCSAKGGLDALGLTADASFVGYRLSSPDVLAQVGDLGVSSRDVTLEQGTPGRVITLEARPGTGLSRTEPLKERFGLSDREIEVLEQLMTGVSNKEISQSLFIAECTVKKHIQSIASKVGARTRTSIAHAVNQELSPKR